MKGKVAMLEKERYEVVKHVKYVDEVIVDCPWIVDADFLQKHHIDWVAGSDDGYTSEGEDIYQAVKSVGKFKEIPRAEGVSSTLILTRIVRDYDAYIHRTLDQGASMRDLKLGYLKGVQVQAKRQMTKLLEMAGLARPGQPTPNLSQLSQLRVGGFIQSFGERMLHSWNVLGTAKELFIRQKRQGDMPSYPDRDAETAEPEGLADLAPQALQLCHEYVPGWSQVDQTDFKITIVSGGLTNKLYKCSISPQLAEQIAERIKQKSSSAYFRTTLLLIVFQSDDLIVTIADSDESADVPHQVLLRIYGAGTETFFNRENEHKIFKSFAASGLGPKLYGIFDGGRIEEFLELHSVDHAELPRLASSVAAQLANVHMVKMQLPQRPSLFDSLHHWLKAAQAVSFPDDPSKAALLQSIHVDKLDAELEELERVLLAANSPVFFCHNDLIGGNIMYNDESKRLCFIDFEYGSYNFRGFDIGNHFCEWTMSYNLKNWPHFALDPKKFPTMEQQRVFLTAYIQERRRAFQERVQSGDPTVAGLKYAGDDLTEEQELQQMILEVNQFALASHFLWSCWAVIQASTSEIPFGYLEFARARLADYYRRKDDFLHKKKFDTIYAVEEVNARPQSPPTNEKRRRGSFIERDQHTFKETHFNRPTWCGHCTYFVVSPFGKQGFECQSCGLKVHRHCKDKVTSKCLKMENL
jgi:choline/ethanolamine kinase